MPFFKLSIKPPDDVTVLYSTGVSRPVNGMAEERGHAGWFLVTAHIISPRAACGLHTVERTCCHFDLPTLPDKSRNPTPTVFHPATPDTGGQTDKTKLDQSVTRRGKMVLNRGVKNILVVFGRGSTMQMSFE